jgi:hypothetical protein
MPVQCEWYPNENRQRQMPAASQHDKTAGCNYSATSQTNRRIKPNLDGSAVSIRFLNQRKHFFQIFILIGSRIFSLILLTGFHFRRQFSRSDFFLFLVLI